MVFEKEQNKRHAGMRIKIQPASRRRPADGPRWTWGATALVALAVVGLGLWLDVPEVWGAGVAAFMLSWVVCIIRWE